MASGVSNDPVNYVEINVTGEDAGPPNHYFSFTSTPCGGRPSTGTDFVLRRTM